MLSCRLALPNEPSIISAFGIVAEGAYLTEPNTGTAFDTLAGVDNNYSLIVPLNISGYNYSQMSLEPYDPVSFVATGPAMTID
jgi:hypothetical protein